MSYIDQNLVLSDAQAVTTTAVSTKSIDTITALRNIGSGEQIEVLVAVGTAFTAAGAATMTVALQDSADNTTFADVLVSPAIAVASLVAGFEALRVRVPATTRRYIALNYTVATGPMTAGALTAVLELDRQDNVARPSGFTV